MLPAECLSLFEPAGAPQEAKDSSSIPLAPAIMSIRGSDALYLTRILTEHLVQRNGRRLGL